MCRVTWVVKCDGLCEVMCGMCDVEREVWPYVSCETDTTLPDEVVLTVHCGRYTARPVLYCNPYLAPSLVCTLTLYAPHARWTMKPITSLLPLLLPLPRSYAPTDIFNASIFLTHWGRMDLNHQ